MLDLQARVDFKEVKLFRRFIVKEFDRAGIPVRSRCRKALGRLIHRAAHMFREIRGRRFLDDFLIAPLHGAVALADGRDLARRRAENLHLDMAGARDIFFEKDAAIAKVAFREMADIVIGRAKFLLVLADADADAAAARRALQHDGIADAVRRLHGLARPREKPRARQQRHARGFRERARRMLEAEAADLGGRRADEDDAGLLAGRCEVRVLRQESISRMHGFRARLLRCRENLLDGEIRLADRPFPEADSFVCVLHMQAVLVSLRIDGDAPDPHFLQRTFDAHGDGTAVGDEHFRKHGGFLLFPHHLVSKTRCVNPRSADGSASGCRRCRDC